MTNFGWGHVPEVALAELADDPGVRAQMSPSERSHIETCDRCRRLLEGHRRAMHLLRSPWQFVGSSELADGSALGRLRGEVRLGAALGPSGRSQRAVLLWLGLLAMLLAIVAGLAIGIGSRPALELMFSGSIAFARGGSLYVATVDGTNESEVVHGDANLRVLAVRWSPDHENLAMVRATGYVAQELLIVSRDGRRLGSFGDASNHSVHFDWAPDGQRIALYWSGRQDAVLIIGLDGRLLDSIDLPDGFLVNGGERGGLSWSPDGRWIAVAACTKCGKTDSNAMLLAADGSSWRWAVDGPATYNADDGYLAWSPDSRLALSQCSTVVLEACVDRTVVIVSIGGATLSDVILPDPLQPAEKAWSPDGSRVAVDGFRPAESRHQLVIVEEDGIAQVVDTRRISPEHIGWTPDGRSVLFSGASDDGAQISLWSVEAAGGVPRRLITDAYDFDVDGLP